MRRLTQETYTTYIIHIVHILLKKNKLGAISLIQNAIQLTLLFIRLQ